MGRRLSSVTGYFTRHPIVAGVVSSVLASALIWLFSWLRDIQVWKAEAPLGLLLLSVPIVLGLGVALILELRLHEDRVFIMVPTFSKEEFFARLVAPLLLGLAERNYKVTLLVASRDNGANSQGSQLDQLEDRKRAFKGGIIIPVDPKVQRDDLIQFVGEFGKPVLFLDTAPFDNDSHYSDNTAFVGTDNERGGKIAAEAIEAELRHKGIQSPRVLVIAGRLQERRQDSFKERLEELMPSADVEVNNQGGFERDRARKIAHDFLNDSISQHRPFHAVFCTNDEMALGVLDALPGLSNRRGRQRQPRSAIRGWHVARVLSALHKSRQRRNAIDALVLCGYDGIEEATTIIDRRDPVLVNTVVQDVDELAQRAVRTLLSMMNGAFLPEREKVDRFEPRIYKSYRINRS